jgi:hypothetical protein
MSGEAGLRVSARTALAAAIVLACQALPARASDRAGEGPRGMVRFVLVQGESGDAPPSADEARAVSQAGDIANAVKTSDCFVRFLAERALIETRGENPREVAARIRALAGTVPVAFYSRCMRAAVDCRDPTAAVAYRQPPEIKIFINRAHFDVTRPGFDRYELAGTFGHEAFGHLLGGYDHAFAWTASRDFSVPYSISGASAANDDAFRHCRARLGY